MSDNTEMPEVIYLQDGGGTTDPRDIEVSWCNDRVNGDDSVYIRCPSDIDTADAEVVNSSAVNKMRLGIVEKEAEIADLQAKLAAANAVIEKLRPVQDWLDLNSVSPDVQRDLVDFLQWTCDNPNVEPLPCGYQAAEAAKGGE